MTWEANGIYGWKEEEKEDEDWRERDAEKKWKVEWRKTMKAAVSRLRHLLFLKLEGEAGFVLAWGTQSVEKQEASRPAHPHG